MKNLNLSILVAFIAIVLLPHATPAAPKPSPQEAIQLLAEGNTVP